MALTTKANVEKYLLTTIDSSFDTQIAAWIAGVDEYINHETRRQIEADASESSHRYDGIGKHKLMIDDFVSISKVETYASITDVDPEDITEYMYYYPANSTPKWRLESTLHLPVGQQNIAVTGIRGTYATGSIPADITQAATVLVAGIVNYSNQSEGEIKSESIGRYTVTYVTEKQSNDYNMAMGTLEHHKRIR